jgi:hypothetical protein
LTRRTTDEEPGGVTKAFGGVDKSVKFAATGVVIIVAPRTTTIGSPLAPIADSLAERASRRHQTKSPIAVTILSISAVAPESRRCGSSLDERRFVQEAEKTTMVEPVTPSSGRAANALRR